MLTPGRVHTPPRSDKADHGPSCLFFFLVFFSFLIVSAFGDGTGAGTNALSQQLSVERLETLVRDPAAAITVAADSFQLPKANHRDTG